MKKITGLFFIYFLLSIMNVYGQEGVYIMDSTKRFHDDFTNFVLYYSADSYMGDIKDILSVPDTLFRKFDAKKLSSLNSFWLKFTAKNNSGHNRPLWLVVGWTDHFEFYCPADSLKPYIGGDMVPARKLMFGDNSRYAVPVYLHPDQVKTFYLHVNGGFYGPPRLLLRFTGMEQLGEITSRHSNNFWQGIFQGILWVMIVYNIFFTAIGKDRTYLYYALYMITVSIYFLNMMGYIRDYVIPDNPALVSYIYLVMQVGVIFYIVFIQKFLSLKKILPLWYKISNYLIVASFLLLIFKIFYFLIFNKFGIFIYVSQLVVILGAVLTVGLIIALYRSRSILARYFMIGSIALGTGLVFSSFMSFSREAFSPAYFASIQLGIVFEILFFSIGLSYKMSENEKQKNSAQQRLIEQLQENERLQTRYTGELEGRVKERTREITEQKAVLEEQKAKLEELNEEKNHLIGIVAHDLRNPLTSARSMINFLKENPERNHEDLPETINIISGSLERMNSMIDKILDIRAIEAQRLNVVPESIDASALVREIIGYFRVKAESKSIQVKTELSGVTINTDRNYLTQIVENLVSNALKFSPDGKSVEIRTYNENGKACIAVTDQGPGFTADDKKRMYLKYQRLSARPTQGESSTGLGLSIVKKFMDALKGEIVFDSEEGKGTTFCLKFDT